MDGSHALISFGHGLDAVLLAAAVLLGFAALFASLGSRFLRLDGWIEGRGCGRIWKVKISKLPFFEIPYPSWIVGFTSEMTREPILRLARRASLCSPVSSAMTAPGQPGEPRCPPPRRQ